MNAPRICALLEFNGISSTKTALPLKMGPMGRPETSIRNYHSVLLEIRKGADLILDTSCILSALEQVLAILREKKQ